MKKNITKTLALIAALCGLNAFATPLVYWNGDLVENSKKGSWTMTKGTGCSFANGLATTTKSGGSNDYTGLILTPDSGSFTANDMTVVVEYSGLEYGNTSKGGHCFLTVTSGSSEYMAGVIPGSQKKARIDCGNEKSTNWNDIPTEGLMAVSFTSSSAAAKKGVRLYFAGKNADGTYKPFGMALYNESLATPTTYSAIRIGGSTKSAGTYYRPKLVIKSVAIHEGATAELGMAYPYTALTCEEFPSETHFVTKKKNVVFKSNASLASISNAVFTAYASGSGMDDKESIACGFCPEYTLDNNGVLTNMQVRFCLADGSTATKKYVKNVLVDFKQVGSDIQYIAVSAGYVSDRTTEVTPSTSWTQTKLVATSATGTDYGMHDITVLVKTQPEVVSVNFAEDNSTHILSNWTDPGAVFADTDWHNVVGANGTDIGIGSVKLTYTSGGTYRKADQGKIYNKGYLDDGSNKGNGPEVTFSNLENGTYNVAVYASTDGNDGARKWRHKTVNGVNYYWNETTGKAAVGTSYWGLNAFSALASEPGTHALLIRKLAVTDGMIVIKGNTSASSGTRRGGISAVQIQKANDTSVDYTGTISAAEATWSSKTGITSSDTWKNDPQSTITLANNDQVASTLTFDENVTAASVTLTSAAGKETTLAKTDGATLNIATYIFSGAKGRTIFGYDPGMLITGPHIRYDLALGERTLDSVIGATGTYEFKSVTLNGAGKKTATLKLVEGDEVTIKNGNTKTVNALQNFDVTGGRLYLGAAQNGAIWWGNGSTGNISGGKVIARATGTTQVSGKTDSGLLLGWSGGATLNISGTGELNVENSSLNFWATSTINITGGKVKTKGAFKGSKVGTVNVGSGGMFELGSLGWASGTGTFNLNGGTLKSYEDGATFNDAITLGAASTIQVPVDQTLTLNGAINGAFGIAKTGEGALKTATAKLANLTDFTLGAGTLKLVLTPEQVRSTTAFDVVATTGAVSAFEGHVTAINEKGLDIPGELSVTGGKLKFLPKVDIFTRTIEAGGEITWTDSGWTKGGESGVPCTPGEGRVGDVTVTLMGNATVKLPASTTSLVSIRFVKGQDVASATVTFDLTPPATLPEQGEVKVVTVPFVSPTLDSGITSAYSMLTLDSGYFAQANGDSVVVGKKSDSISIKFGPRDDTTGKIAVTDENIGGYPVAGLFWNHSKNYSDNNKGTTEVFQFKDGNGATVSDAYCFYYLPNTYLNGNGQTTGNGKMTKSYFDDTVRITPESWPYAVTDSTLGTFYLPKAPGPTHFNMGWEVGITNIPYQIFDLYVYHASDQTTSITLLPMAVKANDGEWKYFKGDTAGSVPCQYNETWSGDPSCDKTPMVEGVNYVRYRLSADALGLPEGTKIEQVFISHPSRSDVTGRLGLAGIQIVKVASTGVYKRKADPVSSTNWTEPETWISGGASATWENPEGSEVAYAQINADNVAKVTVDNAITSTLVTVTSAASSNFTLDGAGELTGPFDLTGFWGALTLSARYDGEVSPAGGRLTLDNAQNNITFATAVSNVTLSGGTLKLTSASQMTADSVLAIAGGTFDMNGLAITRAFTMSGGSLVNNGDSIANNKAQMNTLTLTGNASIGGTGNFGLISNNYEAASLNLGNNTLTKTGANSFWLCNTTISGEGTIRVNEGTLAVDSGTAKNSTFADGTISVGASGALLIAQNRTLTVKNVTLAAANGVTATGTLKISGTLDATAAGATIGKLTFEGTPTVKLTANPLAITTLGFGTDATLVNFDFTGAPFEAWVTAGVTTTQMVSVASFPATRLGTITGVADGWYLDITATGITLNYGTPAKEATVSDQTDLGSLYVPGTETLKGTGGAIASALVFASNAKIVLDPVRTPLKVGAKPVFASGAKIALASAYAETSLGKLTLISWVGGSLGLDAEGLKALVDETTFNSATYTVEETGDDTLRQLVLKIGDYDNDAKDVTISQFGDSITEGIWRSGYRGTPNYRIPLMQMLEAKGYRPVARGFRNVMNGTVPGSSDANGVPAPDAYAWHNGISAQRIYTGMTGSALRAGFMEGVEAHLEQVGVTDIITLKIGTNDAIGGESAENIFEGYTNLVWKIKNMRPTTQIYLCSPIPNHNSSAADERAKAAAASMKAYIEAGHFGGNVFFVDGYNAVPNEDAYYLTDKVHPNWNGYMLLANAFATNIVAKYTSSSPRATEGYTAKTTRTAENNVPEAYRNGYVKLLTFTNVVDKATAWTDGVPYTYTNEQYVAKKFDRIAYYVENKTKVSPDTRFVWVDMDAAEVGRGLSDFCIPTNVQKNVLAKNLHVYSNSSAVENIEPTVEGVNGTIMLTSKGCSDAGSITGAPASAFGLDWNDTLGNTAWGIMTVSRAFSDVTRTDHRIATEAQILFNYNGYNLATHGNSLGIGDFAVHCKQNAGNSEQGTKTLNWIFASDNISSMNSDQLEYGVVEIWGKQGPDGAVSATITDETDDWSKLVWTDTAGDTFTGLTGAFNYTLTGAGKTVALATALKDGATVTLSSGTLNLADGASIGATSTFSIAADATLGVSTTNVVLKASKVTNNGTIAFNGGTAADPIEITGDATSNFGTMTLAANTHVYNKATDNRKHLVTGVGPTSYYYLDGHGLSDGTSLNNLTLVSLGTGDGLWIERGIGENVRLTVPEGKGVMIGNNGAAKGYMPTFIALNGAGTVASQSGANSAVTISCTEAANFSGTSSLPFTIGGTALQTLLGNYTGALTVNSGAQVKLTGSAVPSSITSAGTVTFDYGDGTTKTVSLTSTGTVNINSGTVIFRDYRGAVTLGTDAKVGYTVNINDCGEFTPPTGVAIEKVELYRADGTKIDTTTESGKLKYTWELTDSVCWWDYEFNGTLTNTGTDTTTISKELTDPYYNSTSNALRVGYATPWTNVSAYPDEFTAVLYGKMVDHTNHVEMAFGSTTGGTTVNVAIMCGDPTVHEVKLTIAEAFVTKKTVTMNVPNAYTADHLYAFVCKTINDGGTEKTKVIVYLDGIEWDSYTFPTKVTLGTGFQIGSVHGAVPSGCVKSNTDDKNADLDWLRVYSTVLTTEAMTKYAGRYPYESTNGSAKRTFASAAANWTETNAWKVKPYQQEEQDADKPTPNAIVTIDANVDTTVTFDLNESAAYEQFNVQGESAISLKAGGTVAPTVSGLTTIGTDVTNEWNAVGIGKVMVTEGNTLTFDFTSFPFGNYFKGATNEFTGAVSGAGTIAAIIPDLTGTGRTATFGLNEYGHYALVITVDTSAHPFVYTIDEGSETGVWTWGDDTTDEATVLSLSSATIKKAGTGTQSFVGKNKYTYEVDGGTLKFTNTVTDVTSTITINTGATFDMNGLIDSLYNIVLDGGTLANYGATISYNKKQLSSITLTKNSFVDAGGSFCFLSASYATNTLALGGHTLTKKGDAQFVLVNTVVSNGTVVVEAGQLRINAPDTTVNHTVFTNATLTIKKGAELYVGRSSLTIAAITGDGGTIHVTSGYTLSPFTLNGTINLEGSGNYGTITMAENAVADVGTRHNLTFAGQGSVNVKLTEDEYQPGKVITAFTRAQDATTTVGKVFDPDGKDVTYQAKIDGNTITMRKEATNGTTIYFTLKDAIEQQTGAATIELVADVTDEQTIEVGQTLVLEGGTNILEKVTFSGTGSLTLNTGCIGIEQSGNTTAGGCCRFVEGVTNSWAAYVPSGYKVATLSGAVRPNYLYEFVPAAFVPDPTKDEVLIPVADAKGNDAGAIKLNTEFVNKVTTPGATAQEQAEELNTQEDNGLMKWQNAVLGLENKEGNIPVVATPQQTAPVGYIDFKMGGCNVDTTSGATVKYKVLTAATPGAEVWSQTGGISNYTETVRVELPDSGVKYYKLEVIPETSESVKEEETKAPQVTINGKGYPSLAAAIGDAEAGDTLVVLGDLETGADVNVAKDMTIDMNELTVAGTLNVKSGATLTVCGVGEFDGPITVEDGGKLDFKNGIHNFS